MGKHGTPAGGVLCPPDPPRTNNYPITGFSFSVALQYRFSLGGFAGAINRQDCGIPYVARQFVSPNRNGRKPSAIGREISLRDCPRSSRSSFDGQSAT